tara:strand:+ start:91 stop:390 length:300 start_codon:yes stop_codon:yes gene_type:complete
MYKNIKFEDHVACDNCGGTLNQGELQDRDRDDEKVNDLCNECGHPCSRCWQVVPDEDLRNVRVMDQAGLEAVACVHCIKEEGTHVLLEPEPKPQPGERA